MASPFYVQMPDLFGGQMAARQAAQQDFANKLSQLYAGGNQQAGQALAGVAPDKADAIRAALEKLPGTEQAKVAKSLGILKNNLYAISQATDPGQKSLMWSSMLGQIQQAGGDISSLAPQWSPQAEQAHMAEVFDFEQAFKMSQEKRLSETADKMGQSAQERQFLADGDPRSPQWQDLFSKRYRPTISMSGLTQVQLIPDDILAKAISGGMTIPTDWVTPEQAARIKGESDKPAAPESAGMLSPEAASAAGLAPGGISGTSIAQVQGMKTPEQLKLEAERREETRLKPMPTQLGQALIDNRKSVRQLESTLQLIDNPEAASTLGPQNMLPGANLIANYFGSPDENSLRGLISALQSMTYKDTSGATVTAAEEGRLQQYIPTVKDKSEVAKTKVERFLKEYNQIIADVEAFINSQGYKPFKPSEGGAAKKQISHPSDIEAILKKHGK